METGRGHNGNVYEGKIVPIETREDWKRGASAAAGIAESLKMRGTLEDILEKYGIDVPLDCESATSQEEEKQLRELADRLRDQGLKMQELLSPEQLEEFKKGMGV